MAITGLPCRHLRGVDLTRRGNVTDIIGRAFVAGALPLKVSVVGWFFLPHGLSLFFCPPCICVLLSLKTIHHTRIA